MMESSAESRLSLKKQNKLNAWWTVDGHALF